MHVISKSRLREYWEQFPATRTRLMAWFSVATRAEWSQWADVLASFPQADQVGDCVVFNIGNAHRLIGRIRYRTQRVYVLRVLTHAEYDRRTWPDECGCYESPPVRRNGKNPRGT